MWLLMWSKPGGVHAQISTSQEVESIVANQIGDPRNRHERKPITTSGGGTGEGLIGMRAVCLSERAAGFSLGSRDFAPSLIRPAFCHVEKRCLEAFLRAVPSKACCSSDPAGKKASPSNYDRLFFFCFFFFFLLEHLGANKGPRSPFYNRYDLARTACSAGFSCNWQMTLSLVDTTRCNVKPDFSQSHSRKSIGSARPHDSCGSQFGPAGHEQFFAGAADVAFCQFGVGTQPPPHQPDRCRISDRSVEEIEKKPILGKLSRSPNHQGGSAVPLWARAIPIFTGTGKGLVQTGETRFAN